MITRLSSILILALALASPSSAIEDSWYIDFAVEMSDGGDGSCSDYMGGELQDGCEYEPASFSPESDYGPGDREGGIPSDGNNCFDYSQWYYDAYGCG